MSKKNLYILIITALVILGYNFLSKERKTLSEQPNHNIVTPRNIAVDIDGTDIKDRIAKEEDLNNFLSVKSDDIIMGNNDSPVTIIEYSSLSCPHCKYFYENILGILKEKYIDQGKVKIIHRDYPLDAPSLAGAVYLRCINKEKYFEHLKILFDKQAEWAYKSNYSQKLSDFAKMDGMTEEEFNLCFANKEQEKHVIESRAIAEEKLKINAAPVYIINNKMYFGLKEKEFFVNKIEEILANNTENPPKTENPQKDLIEENEPIVENPASENPPLENSHSENVPAHETKETDIDKID